MLIMNIGQEALEKRENLNVCLQNGKVHSFSICRRLADYMFHDSRSDAAALQLRCDVQYSNVKNAKPSLNPKRANCPPANLDD
jgi:hypothetical protein